MASEKGKDDRGRGRGRGNGAHLVGAGSYCQGYCLQYLLGQHGDMPSETAPRGSNAFYTKGKDRGKGKGK